MKNEKFEAYFRGYKNLILRLVLDRTGDYQVAQEICQQVFIQFYINMDKVYPDMVKAWLIRCTKNAVVDYFRKANVRKAVMVDLEVVEEGNLVAEEMIEHCNEKRDNAELTGKILADVKSVNEKWYEVLVMCCVEGMSYPEMAEKLNMSIDALRARVHRARSYVRERFGEEYQEFYKD